MPALHGAAQFSGVDPVRVLLDAGAEVNAPDHEDKTELMYAVRTPWTTPQVIQLLRDHRGDPTISNQIGDSPLARVQTVDNKTLIIVIVWGRDCQI